MFTKKCLFLVTISVFFSLVGAPAADADPQPQCYTLASLQGAYAVIGLYGDHLALALTKAHLDGNGNFTSTFVGIGRGIALRLAAEGCHFAICGRTEDVSRRTAEEVAALGRRVLSITADATKPWEVGHFVDDHHLRVSWHRLAGGNVGGSYGTGLLDVTPENWRATFDLSLFHDATVTRAVVASMRERGGGGIVFVPSISGWKRVHRQWQYGAAKAALIHTARCLALELAALKIRVNSVRRTIFIQNYSESTRV